MRVESLDNQHKRDMNQCLHCNNPCAETALFCDACQSQLYKHNEASQIAAPYEDIADITTAPRPIVMAPQNEHEHIKGSESTIPLPHIAIEPSYIPIDPQTPLPSVHGVYVNIVDHAIHRLNDAARRIAAVEQSEKRQPRASRLAPLRDISADIQRQSTPLPKTIANTVDASQKSSEANASNMPDLWPWLPDTDDIDNNNTWENYTDPLLSRRFPDSIEAARIDAEDERRARAEGLITTSFLRRPTRTVRLRIAFVSLAILAVLALTIDTALVSVAFLHPHHKTPVPVSGPPTLTITSEVTKDNQATLGRRVFFHLMHFNPSTTVLITHDVEVPVILSTGIPSVQTGKDGTATASTTITGDWGPGFHTVDAEDVQSHYTANATLQIIDSGPSKPSHLIIKDTSLDLGSGYQGSNTIQPFTLSNDDHANGAITWAASSNKPWLVLTPNQGTFSSTQTISISVARGTLASGAYNGKISFSSNVGAPITVQVEMTVIALPANAGAVLMIAPAVLSFTSQDGASTTTTPQVLVVSNPGHQTLSWSLTNNQPTAATNQNSSLGTPGITTNWLTTNVTSGTVAPGETESVIITVNSQSMLPGTYINSLAFSSPDSRTINRFQSVSVSLTVQQHCSLSLSTGGMTFTAVSNSNNTSNQSLTASASASCNSAVNWNATTSMSWLTITPASGSAKTGNSSVITVGVNAATMGPGSYVGTITVVSAAQGGSEQGSTQTVTVVLDVQKPPPLGAPVLAAAPLTLGFSTVQGQPVSSGQTVLITNSGQSVLQWHTTVSMLATSWLDASPTGGRINPGQTATLTVFAVSTGLTPGTYNGQVMLNGLDNTGQVSPGSPQTVAIQLQVNPPCALVQPSSSALAFTAIQGSSDPAPQSVTVSASGNCMWPLGWKASVSPVAPWLTLSSSAGSFGQGGLSNTLGISTTIANLAPGTYTTQVSISASDASGVIAQGSPQVFSITLVVQPPCQMAPVPAHLAFAVAEGQVTPTRTFPLREIGTCTRPVTWSATGDASSASWLVVSPPSGSDTGSGATISVSVNAASLPPGIYRTNVTVTANNSATISSSTQTIPIVVRVTGFTISGTVNICGESTCTNPPPVALPAASIVLTNAAGTQIATATADANGNYTISNVGLGTYTLSASGTSSTLHYVGSAQIVVTGTMPGSNIALQQG